MIISKTPLRIPFAGGLTDLKEYADKRGGITISTTIDKYIYVGVKSNVDGYFNLKYLDAHEKVRERRDIRHAHVREALKLLKMDGNPVDIYIMTDLNYESGLGSSGAVTIGLLNALHAFKGESPDVYGLIDEASIIEMDILEGAGGYHDHSITALGGLRGIHYADGISDDQLFADPELVGTLQDRLLFFYSGHHAKTKPSLDVLSSKLKKAKATLGEIADNAEALWSDLAEGSLQNFGQRIQTQQDLKQRLPGHFSSDMVDGIMARVLKNGAFAQIPGGKIGAFLMVYCPDDGVAAAIREEFTDIREIHFSFSPRGTIVTEI